MWQGVTGLVKARRIIGLLCRLSGLSPEGQIVSPAQFPYLAKTWRMERDFCSRKQVIEAQKSGLYHQSQWLSPAGFQSRVSYATLTHPNAP